MVLCLRQFIDLLNAQSLKANLHLIAGESGLASKVDSITIMEVADFPTFVEEENLFVLTTFSFCMNDEACMVKTFHELIEKKISALAIKVGRFIKEVPQSMLKIADDNKLPLFIVNEEVPFRQLITKISRTINDAEQEVLIEVNKRYENLYQAMLRGETTSYFLNIISSLVNKSAYCFDQFGNLIYQSDNNSLSKVKLHDGFHEMMSKFDTNLDYQYLAENSAYIFKCIGFNQILGYLVIPSEAEMLEFKLLQIQQIQTFISLRLMDTRLLDNMKAKEKDLFLHELLLNNSLSTEEIKMGFQSNDFALSSYYQLIYIDIKEVQYNLFLRQPIIQLLDDLFDKADHYMFESFEDGFIILLSLEDDKKEKTDYYAQRIYSIINFHAKNNPKLKLVFSHFFADIAAFSELYSSCQRALAINKKLLFENNFIDNDNYSIFHLFYSMYGSRNYDVIKRRIINPITKLDNPNGKYWDTLEACIWNDSLQAAADQLFIHTTTIRYRLEKIESVTGADYFNSIGYLDLTHAYLFHLIETLFFTGP